MESVLKQILTKKPNWKIIFRDWKDYLVREVNKKTRYTLSVYPEFITVSEYTRDGCHSSPYYWKMQNIIKNYLIFRKNVEKIMESDYFSCCPIEYFKL